MLVERWTAFDGHLATCSLVLAVVGISGLHRNIANLVGEDEWPPLS